MPRDAGEMDAGELRLGDAHVRRRFEQVHEDLHRDEDGGQVRVAPFPATADSSRTADCCASASDLEARASARLPGAPSVA